MLSLRPILLTHVQKARNEPRVHVFSSSSAEVFAAPQGTVRAWHPAPGVLATSAEGVLLDEAAAKIEQMARRMAAEHGTIVGFHDWERLQNYETEARIRLTGLVRSLGRQSESASFLVQSRIVALGIHAASILVPGLLVYTRRSEFEDALEQAVRRRMSAGPGRRGS